MAPKRKLSSGPISKSTTTTTTNGNSNGNDILSPVAQTLQAPIPNPFNNTPSINNQQLVKLIIQYLSNLDVKGGGQEFASVAKQLTELTGIELTDKLTEELIDLVSTESVQLEDLTVTKKIDSLVDQLANDRTSLDGTQTMTPTTTNGNNLQLKRNVQILIKKRLFMESLILESNTNKALRILRNLNNDYFGNDSSNLLINRLSSLLILMDNTPSDSPQSSNGNVVENEKTDKEQNSLFKQLNWEHGSTFTRSRELLVDEIMSLLPSDKVLPPNRLLTLIDQSLTFQRQNDPYYIPTKDTLSNLTLYKDYNKRSSSDSINGDRIRFPKNLKYKLDHHENECWFVKYSNSGNYLASASVDKSIIIYSCNDQYQIYKKLLGHESSIIYMSWSADDTKLLTSSFDLTVKIWDVTTGDVITTISNTDFFKSNLRVWSLEFFKKSDNFIIASPDKKLSIFNISGELIYDFEIEYRVDDFTIINDEKLLVITHSSELLIYDLTTSSNYRLVSAIKIRKKLTSISATSSDPDHVIINVKPDEVQLWNVANIEQPFLENKYYGLQHSDYIIRGCLSDKNLVLSGSEEGLIYIWNRKFGNLIEVLQGHSALINCIDWRCIPNDDENEDASYEWASCADDGVVNVWGL